MNGQGARGRHLSEPGRRGAGWIGRYTLGALAVYLVWILGMAISGRGLICHSDAYLQQYTTLRYTAAAVRRLFSGEGFAMVDPALGQGLDALSSLGFYGLTNPLYWLGALLSGQWMELYYYALVFLYSYLSGLTFGLYLKRSGLVRPGWAISVGAWMFAFCGYNTAGLLKTPYFAAGSVCLCLMLWSIERFMATRRWLMMTLMTLLALLVNFYHGYQTLMMAAAYVLLRLICGLPKRGFVRTLKDGLAIAGACLAGLLLSGFMLLPMLAAFMGSARSGAASGYTASLWRYPMAFYGQLAADFAAPYAQADYWTQLSFMPWAAAGVVALFVGGREIRGRAGLRIGFVLALAGLCVPAAGRLFNGMSYAANRWSYGFDFVCCACAAAALPALARGRYGRRRLVGVLLLAWAAVMLALAVLGVPDDVITQKVLGVRLNALLIGFGALLLVAVAVWLLRLDGRLEGAGNRVRPKRFICVTAALCCLAYTAGYAVMMPAGTLFYRRGLDGRIAGDYTAKAGELTGEDFFRVDAGFDTASHAPLQGYAGTGYYWSIIPRTVADYYIALEAPTLRWTFQLGGLGGDPYLSAAAAVKYAVRPESPLAILPYGFEDAGDGVYENAQALPLGVFYEKTMSEADWRALSPIQKRQALLRCAVMAGAQSTQGAPEGGSILPVTAVPGEGGATLLLQENGAGTLSGGASGAATIAWDAPADSLNWLWIRDVTLLSGGSRTYQLVYTGDDAGQRNAFYVSDPRGNYYYKQSGVFVYLGEGGPGQERTELKLETAGEIRFSDMRIVSVPTGDYTERVRALSQNGWSPRMECNAVRGRYYAPKAGVLQISLPFLEGWRAWVDGEERPIGRCGGMYMGLGLEAGEHDIQLKYETPYLRHGALATLIGVLAVAVALIAGRQLKRR